MLGPFATASRRTPINQMSLLMPPARIDVHDNANDANDDDNDNAWQRGPLWPHGMGSKTIFSGQRHKVNTPVTPVIGISGGVVGRFAYFYCSMGWDDSHTSCGGCGPLGGTSAWLVVATTNHMEVSTCWDIQNGHKPKRPQQDWPQTKTATKWCQNGLIHLANEKTSSVTQLYVEFGITYRPTTIWVSFGLQVGKTPIYPFYACKVPISTICSNPPIHWHYKRTDRPTSFS